MRQSYKNWDRAEQRIRKARWQEQQGVPPEDRADWIDKQKTINRLRSESERQRRQAEGAQSLPSGTASAAPPVSESASSGLVEVASTASEAVASPSVSTVADVTMWGLPPNDARSVIRCGVVPQPTPAIVSYFRAQIERSKSRARARSTKKINRRARGKRDRRIPVSESSSRTSSPAGSGSASVRDKTPLPDSRHRNKSSNELLESHSPASGAQAKRAKTSDDGGEIEPKPASKKMPKNVKACASTGPPTAVPQDPELWRSVNSAAPPERDMRRQLGLDVGSTPPDALCHFILVHCYGRVNSDRNPRHFWLNVEWDRDTKDKAARDRKADRFFLPPTWT